MGSERAKDARERAEAQFQKRAKVAREGDAARAEYAAVSRAVDEKTTRLKSLRLANEAESAKAKQQAAKPKGKKG